VTQPRIPKITDACPTLQAGDDMKVTVLGQEVHLWVGSKQTAKQGTVFFYWHGTGSHSGEATTGLGPIIKEITDDGGVVASFEGTTKQGQDLNNSVWFEGDFAMADIILACAVQQLNIDTKRVYTGGCSAGGLAAGTMAYLRSSYIAAAMPNSGGIVRPFDLDEPGHAPSIMTAHGSFDADFVAPAHFKTTSLDECTDIASRGGFAVDCEHSAGHCQVPSEVTAAQWTFVKAHSFGVKPEPYAAGLPANFPSYCSIVPAGPPSQLACHTSVECGAGKSCCFTVGPNNSTITGTKSECVAAGADNGPFGTCPSGQFQLCSTNSTTPECSAGLHCTAPTNAYCTQ
jgi:dienelactone hydrolase